MAHINHETKPVHFPDDLPAHACDTGVVFLVTAGRQQALVVVGKLHETGAELITDFHQVDVILDGGGVLESKEDSGTLTLAGRINVFGVIARHDEFRVAGEMVIPLPEVGNDFPEIFMIGDRNVHGRQTGVVHLAENFFRPVAVLQAVDKGHGHSADSHSRRRWRRFSGSSWSVKAVLEWAMVWLETNCISPGSSHMSRKSSGLRLLSS